MKKLIILFILFPCIGYSQSSYQEDSAFIKKISDTMLTSRAAYNNLYYLTKKIGGRLAGSPQMVKAEKWGQQAMETAGADKVSMQQCMVPHWVRGGKEKTVIAYKDKNGRQYSFPVSVTALGNSIGTGAKGVKASVVRVTSFDDLETKKNELKGKIVFYSVPFDEKFIQTPDAYGASAVYRATGAIRAAKYGAAAVIVRSMTHAVDNNPHTGSMNYKEGVPKIPAVAIGVRDVEKIDALINEGQNLAAQIFTYGKMLPDTIGHNIIGELTGSEHPEKIITVGGHLDSWDICEGATDDGAGIVQTIEILRTFKALGYRPKNTIRFVLFANEENGARGGNKYGEEALANKEQHIFALESDAGGFTPRFFSLDISDAILAKMNKWIPLLRPYGIDYIEKGGGGVDIGPLCRVLNVPGGELRPDSQRYFDVHHSAGDVLEAVNMRELKLGAINMAALLYLIDKYGL